MITRHEKRKRQGKVTLIGYISVEMRDRLNELASTQGMSRNEYLNRILRRSLGRKSA